MRDSVTFAPWELPSSSPVTELRLSASIASPSRYEAEFDAVVRAQYAPLVALATHYVHSQDAAEDIVQDVFAAVWSRRDQFDFGHPLPYLCRSTRNRAISALRHSRVQANHAALVVSEVRAGGFEGRAATATTSPEATELEAAIPAAVAALPERCRAVFLLSRDAGMSYSEIGKTLGISEKTVETHMSKALRSLHDALSPFLTLVAMAATVVASGYLGTGA